MRTIAPALTLVGVLMTVFEARAQSVDAPEPTAGDVPAESVGAPPIFRGKLYGFIEGRFEKVADSPVGPGPDGEPLYVNNPHEFDVPALHIMAQAVILERFRFFLNLAGPGSGSPTADELVSIRNAWAEAPLAGRFASVRVGKLYRKFGIYNEQLDAVPYFPGIEPPELFDGDHLLLTRTTNFMVHGSFPISATNVSYAIMTGNDERKSGQIPIGLDLRLDYEGVLLIGSSFYSSVGDAVPTRGVGEGAPNGGVANWMATDEYFVYGGFVQLSWDDLLFQVEFWQAQHKAQRDPSAVIRLLDADLNPQQLNRFGLAGATPTEADVPVNVEYRIDTAYARIAYEFALADADAELPWTATPYLQADYYRNPESIRQKSFGGDNEAGIADDGRFIKVTAGLILRPTTAIAFKIDGSGHLQKVAGKQTFYPELRLSLAYYWELGT